MNSKELALFIAETASDKKAESTLVLDVEEQTIIAEYFVITSAQTQVQTRDICRSIEKEVENQGIVHTTIKGLSEASWIVMDYGSIIVHIFLNSEREYYNLEERWREANIIYSDSENKNSQPTPTPTPNYGRLS